MTSLSVPLSLPSAMSLTGARSGTRTAGSALGAGRLRGVGAKEPILQRRPVEPADDGIHLIGVRRVNKREALGLLRFRVADDFDCVRDQVFG